MLNKLWKSFDDLFKALDEDIDELNEQQNTKMKDLISRVHPTGETVTETVHEEEVKPDGTRITRTITTSRSTTSSRTKTEVPK